MIHGWLQEPRLLRLLIALLQAHSEWFRLQRCRDRFAGPLGLDALRGLQTAETGEILKYSTPPPLPKPGNSSLHMCINVFIPSLQISHDLGACLPACLPASTNILSTSCLVTM